MIVSSFQNILNRLNRSPDEPDMMKTLRRGQSAKHLLFALFSRDEFIFFQIRQFLAETIWTL